MLKTWIWPNLFNRFLIKKKKFLYIFYIKVDILPFADSNISVLYIKVYTSIHTFKYVKNKNIEDNQFKRDKGGLKSSYDGIISAIDDFLTNGIQALQQKWKKKCKLQGRLYLKISLI